ncbi:hypothetical protein DEU56DRAFT_824433, partial [Suillus clintonianus]|uniref:uncharacterized protein n=1 Tax=Suillus clintonianus TaxID=1904413 RepID=UPI001B8799C0
VSILILRGVRALLITHIAPLTDCECLIPRALLINDIADPLIGGEFVHSPLTSGSSHADRRHYSLTACERIGPQQRDTIFNFPS